MSVKTKDDIKAIYHYKGIHWNGEQYFMYFICIETNFKLSMLPEDLESGERELNFIFLDQIRALRDYQRLTGITDIS